LQVKQTSLPPEVSGAIIKKRGEDPVILIEEADSDNRKRFTCAHELGHFIDRSERGEENFEFVDLRDASSSSGTNADEVFANQFAAALLMPEELVRQQWAENKVVPFLAVAFGVSADAMTFRLKNLGLVR
jgi:Zn-dependent peptidase ImmA (M78 family)